MVIDKLLRVVDSSVSFICVVIILLTLDKVDKCPAK
jgi:hypothetical protein